MSHVPHELAEEFPQHAQRMHDLKQTDGHFARLFDDHHRVNRAVHRAETDIEPMEDVALVDLRKQRAALKDAVYRIVTA